MTTHVRTFYSVRTMTLVKYRNQDPYWTESGIGPGGRTIEEAYNRIRKDMARIGFELLDEVKFDIVKTVETEEIVEEVPGNHASLFMLKG